MKNKNISALLSLLFPGLGQLYIGKYTDAVVFILGASILWFAIFRRSYYLMTFDNPKSFLVWGSLAAIYLYSIFDAYAKTK
jgi:TM2 domain-containing membrane protein YozV